MFYLVRKLFLLQLFLFDFIRVNFIQTVLSLFRHIMGKGGAIQHILYTIVAGLHIINAKYRMQQIFQCFRQPQNVLRYLENPLSDFFFLFIKKQDIKPVGIAPSHKFPIPTALF